MVGGGAGSGGVNSDTFQTPSWVCRWQVVSSSGQDTKGEETVAGIDSF